MLRIREGKPSDAYELVGRLREEDWNELYASDGRDPDETLLESWDISSLRWTAIYDNQVACIFGVGVGKNTPEGVGIPWLLGSDKVIKFKKTFVKESRKYIDLMLCEYQILINFIDIRNSLSIRWLQWLGFQFSDPQPFGPFHMPFMMFTLKKGTDV